MAHVGSQVRTVLTLNPCAGSISLNAFNCQPIQFQAQAANGMEKVFPDGLNTLRAFHFVFMDVSITCQGSLKAMRSLQPKTPVCVLVRQHRFGDCCATLQFQECLSRNKVLPFV